MARLGRRREPATADERRAGRTRRRFARRQWARRWGVWRWVAVGVLLAALLGTGVWLVWFSAALSLERVTVSGTGYLTAEEVRVAAGLPEGEPLARLDLGAAAARVEALAPVRSASVTRAWPHDVRIEVSERTAVAVVRVGSQVRGMDADGVIFRSYPRQPKDLPLIVTGGTADIEARREAATVASSLPADLAARVDHLEVTSVDAITLQLRDGRTVVWGSADQSDLKARVLEGLLSHRARQYDVSVPGNPTLRE